MPAFPGSLYRWVGSDQAAPQSNTMTYFPQNFLKPPASLSAAAFAPVRQAIIRDILWNRPVFKAPVLPSPRVAVDPLPFTAARVTRRSR